MQELGWECVGFSEIDQYATKVYSSHFPSHPNYGDITRIDAATLPDFDLLCGGFPCQPFSVAGERRGFSDTRGTLFFDLCRIAAAKRPRLLLFENVRGLLSHDGGRTFGTILSSLDELGYDVQWQVCNSKHFGVPQGRERVFIVGHLRGEPRPKVFPIIGNCGSHAIEITRGVHQAARVYDPRGISPTLRTTNSGGSKQPMILERGRVRRLTITECERLQGFPDGWTTGVSETRRLKTLGNAVAVPVVRSITSRLTRTPQPCL